MFKIVVSIPEEKRAVQVEKDVPTFIGMRIGEKFDGSMIGLNGYTLEITGGSDKEGFPMRKDLPGTARKKALLTSGVGFRGKKKMKKGMRVMKTIRGNRIAEDIVQVNVKVVEKKSGAKSVEELFGLEPKEKPDEKEVKGDETAEKKEAVKEAKTGEKKEPEKKGEQKEKMKPVKEKATEKKEKEEKTEKEPKKEEKPKE